MLNFTWKYFAVSALLLAGTSSLAEAAAATLPVRSGRFEVMQNWVHDRDTSSDALAARISFLPNPQAAPACSMIRFIQTARMVDPSGKNFRWGYDQANRNSMMTESGYFVDHDAHLCQAGASCSPYYRDSWANSSDKTQEGSVSQNVAVPSIMTDYPYGWDQFESIFLEACAVCADNQSILACVKWGGYWPALGEDRMAFAPEASDKPSRNFTNALNAFWKFYGK